MENNEIMQRLLQDDKQSSSDKKVTEKQSNEKDVSISRIRIVTAKYKVYIVLLLIFIAALLFKFIPNASDAYDTSKDAYAQAKTQLTNVEKDIEIAKGDMDYLCNEDS
jgi:cell division protein FtsL